MNLLNSFIFLLISLLSAVTFAVPPTPAKYQAYGSFNLPARDAESAQTYLTRLVQEAREPKDPPIAIHFINSSSQIAEIAPAGYGRGYEIYISNGFIKHMGSEDMLFGIISHEVRHAGSTFGLSDFLQEVQSQREELITADLGAMQTMRRVGRDPREYRRFFVESARRSFRATGYSAMNPRAAAEADHPPNEIRISAAEAWLRNEHGIAPFPEPRPIPPILRQIQESVPTVPPEIIQAKPIDFTRRLLATPWFQSLGPVDQVKVFQAAVSSVSFQGELEGALNSSNILSHQARLINLATEMTASRGTWAPLLRRRLEAEGFDLYPILNEFLQRYGGSPPHEVITPINQFIDGLPSFLPHEQHMALLEVFRPSPQVHSLQEYLELPDNYFPEQKWRILLRATAEAQNPIELRRMWDQIATESESRNRAFDGHPLRCIGPFREAALLRYGEVVRAAIQKGDTAFLRKPIPVLFDPSYFNLFPDPVQRQFVEIAIEVGQNQNLSRMDRYYFLKSLDLTTGFLQREFTSLDDFLSFSREAASTVTRRAEGRSYGRDTHGADLLTGNDIQFVLNTHPEWLSQLTASQVITIAQDPHFTFKMKFGDYSNQDVAAVTKMAQKDPDLARSLDRGFDLIERPAYRFNQEETAVFQRRIIQSLRANGNWPTDVRERVRLITALAAHGATDVTDQLIAETYLHDGFRCMHCLIDVLGHGQIFDFEIRRRVFDRWRSFSHFGEMPAGLNAAERRAKILEFISRVELIFPEVHPVRSRILEDFSRRIRARQAEAALIEQVKAIRDANGEGLAIKAMSALLEASRARAHHDEELRYRVSTSEEAIRARQVALIRFLLGKGSLPQFFRDSYSARDLRTSFSPDQIQRLFNALPIEAKTIFLNTFLVAPRGLFAFPESREALIQDLVSQVSSYSGEGRLILDALLHALRMTAPEQESLGFAMLLAHSSRSDVHVGAPQQLRIFLESMRGTGAAIAQQIVQRRLLGPEFVSELKKFLNFASEPARHENYKRASETLGTPNLDSKFVLGDLLGVGSARIVSGLTPKKAARGRPEDAPPTEALTYLRENFERSVEVESQQLQHLLDYLEQNGGPTYRRFRGALEAVQRRLRVQADLGLEERNYPRMARIYRSGRVRPSSGFEVVVVRPKTGGPAKARHVRAPFATGVSLMELPPHEQARVFSAIYEIEEEVLLSPSSIWQSIFGRSGRIWFERDRHQGNYRVDLSRTPPRLWIFDYPLMGEITVGRRDALMRIMGLIHLLKTGENPPAPLLAEINRLVFDVLNSSGWISSSDRERIGERLSQAVLNSVHTNLNADGDRVTDHMMDLFSSAEHEGIQVDESVNDYLAALGNLEIYGIENDARGNPTGRNRLVERLEQLARRELVQFMVRRSVLNGEAPPGLENQTSCMARALRAILPRN